MADIFEFTLTLDLRDAVSEEELTELRWHLGLGPRPERLRLVTAFPCVRVDEDGAPVVDDCPEPLLGRRGEAWKVGGTLVSALRRREGAGGGGWALTSRQELHPDEFERAGELLGRLAARAGEGHRRPDGGIVLGTTRFHASERAEPLVVRDGVVGWPS
ncbi:hypothetical protein SLA_1072 [Streptomyces laurentii]|uniref:Uncharacterized protein n=1 Tax=Streptomyces laurentii TaxID=39478 RepID=A0A160NVR9_STRLU|nr:hypothetical protein SLA_1072 [Streptomyces laurentii]